MEYAFYVLKYEYINDKIIIISQSTVILLFVFNCYKMVIKPDFFIDLIYSLIPIQRDFTSNIKLL